MRRAVVFDYQQLVKMAKRDLTLTETHSVEEAEARHEIKHGKRRKPKT